MITGKLSPKILIRHREIQRKMGIGLKKIWHHAKGRFVWSAASIERICGSMLSEDITAFNSSAKILPGDYAFQPHTHYEKPQPFGFSGRLRTYWFHIIFILLLVYCLSLIRQLNNNARFFDRFQSVKCLYQDHLLLCLIKGLPARMTKVWRKQEASSTGSAPSSVFLFSILFNISIPLSWKGIHSQKTL